jgi:hypothetical protein
MRSVAALALTALAAACPGRSGTVPRIDAAVEEPSGLTKSPGRPGVLWTHADSGDEPHLYAIDSSGKLLDTTTLEGATHVDWEAITTDAEGRLYVGDIGNNKNRRKDLVVYRLGEPKAGETQRGIERSIEFRYPDQRAFPDEDALNFDAEALFHAEGSLYVLTKHRSDNQTTLYRFPDLEADTEVTLLARGSFDLGPQPSGGGGMATDASVTPDGKTLAVLSYHAIFLFERPAGSDAYLQAPLATISFDTDVIGQCEAIAWDGNGLWIANEAGDLFRLEDPLGGGWTRFPRGP